MYSGKHHGQTGSATQGHRSMYAQGQAQYIAGRLQQASGGATHGNGYPTAGELDRKLRARVTLRWFSFEEEGAHKYRRADSQIILGDF